MHTCQTKAVHHEIRPFTFDSVLMVFTFLVTHKSSPFFLPKNLSGPALEKKEWKFMSPFVVVGCFQKNVFVFCLPPPIIDQTGKVECLSEQPSIEPFSFRFVPTCWRTDSAIHSPLVTPLDSHTPLSCAYSSADLECSRESLIILGLSTAPTLSLSPSARSKQKNKRKERKACP